MISKLGLHVVERARFIYGGSLPKVERSHPLHMWVTTLSFGDQPSCCCVRVQRHVLYKTIFQLRMYEVELFSNVCGCFFSSPTYGDYVVSLSTWMYSFSIWAVGM